MTNAATMLWLGQIDKVPLNYFPNHKFAALSVLVCACEAETSFSRALPQLVFVMMFIIYLDNIPNRTNLMRNVQTI